MVYALVVLTVVVVVIAAYGLLRLRARARRLKNRRPAPAIPVAPRAQALKLKETGKYWGYRVQSHCGASSRFSGREYEIDEAPPLPVEHCGTNPCACCLVGLPDRRRPVERRSGQDRRRSLRMESEDRRNGYPRRKKDLQDWKAYRHL